MMDSAILIMSMMNILQDRRSDLDDPTQVEIVESTPPWSRIDLSKSARRGKTYEETSEMKKRI